ncbi:hypothetical protein OAS86_06380 [Gammaproteobacteria bacterium]|nr:hypothetical protein [Gammaproteobacteria bacterium]
MRKRAPEVSASIVDLRCLHPALSGAALIGPRMMCEQMDRTSLESGIAPTRFMLEFLALAGDSMLSELMSSVKTRLHQRYRECHQSLNGIASLRINSAQLALHCRSEELAEKLALELEREALRVNPLSRYRISNDSASGSHGIQAWLANGLDDARNQQAIETLSTVVRRFQRENR